MTKLSRTGMVTGMKAEFENNPEVHSVEVVTNADEVPKYFRVVLDSKNTHPIFPIIVNYGLKIGMASINDGRLKVTLGPE